ncbi:hypothetical protein [Ralstonia solanacearum]|uniref:hypothetical protein n=1 Tax=Ralstonia solanacearum TaxID=305 RepID=UPI000B1BF4EE|nr:hypothetical protein [Ralstonia solanacearum]
MKIDDDHMYHGAALIQIAEHENFTAINSMKIGKKIVPMAYRINDAIAVYLKHGNNPTESHSEYQFGFNKNNLRDLASISSGNEKTFIALICVKDREICCIEYGELIKMIDARKKAKGAVEDQYTILVTARKNEKMRAYMNMPGRKNTMLSPPIKVSRNGFPGLIFD